MATFFNLCTMMPEKKNCDDGGTYSMSHVHVVQDEATDGIYRKQTCTSKMNHNTGKHKFVR